VADNDRRIWAYPLENFQVDDDHFEPFQAPCSHIALCVPRQIMRAAMKLRAALVPYFYSQARVAYETGLSIVHPVRAPLPAELISL
jgi:hypothetical protein